MPGVATPNSAGIVAHVAFEYADMHVVNDGPVAPTAPAFVKVIDVGKDDAAISYTVTGFDIVLP